MFVRNRTSHEPVLARGHIDDQTSVACVAVRVDYRVRPDGALGMLRGERSEDELPDVRRHAVWLGVSVTASGLVRPPVRAPFTRIVRLEVGDARHELTVFGPRRWRRESGGDLVPSTPEPFEPVPLTWSHAFGGSAVLEPGYLPGTELPHPGGKLVYPLNPDGVGFYPSASAALEQPLPQIEYSDCLIRRWHDRPEPAGFAPCPALAGLRLRTTELSRSIATSRDASMRANAEELAVNALRMHHHAPGRLVVARLARGTRLRLEGLGSGACAFTVPESPIAVRWQGSRQRNGEIPGRLRALHIDAENTTVSIVFAHARSYPSDSPPSWIHVEQAA